MLDSLALPTPVAAGSRPLPPGGFSAAPGSAAPGDGNFAQALGRAAQADAGADAAPAAGPQAPPPRAEEAEDDEGHPAAAAPGDAIGTDPHEAAPDVSALLAQMQAAAPAHLAATPTAAAAAGAASTLALDPEGRPRARPLDAADPTAGAETDKGRGHASKPAIVATDPDQGAAATAAATRGAAQGGADAGADSLPAALSTAAAAAEAGATSTTLPAPMPVPTTAPPGQLALAGAPATGQAQLAAPPGSPAFAPQFGALITTFVQGGVEHAQLHLNPAELGPVSVQIQLDGAAAQVHLAAEQPATRQALQEAMPLLASALREAGLTLAGGGVFEQPRQAREQARRDAGPARGAGGRSADVQTAPLAAATHLRRRGVVDLVA